MTRPTLKSSLVALSLAATLGSWAILAQNDGQRAPVAPETVVQTLDLPPIPTLVRPLPAAGVGTVNARGAGSLGLPPIPAVSVPVVPRPIARTRSSR